MRPPGFLSFFPRSLLRQTSRKDQRLAVEQVRGLKYTMVQGGKLLPAARVAGRKQDVW